MDAPQLLESLSTGTKELIEQHRQLSARVKALQKQLDVHQSDLQHLSVEKETLIKENRDLKEQIKTIKLAQSLTAGTGDQNSKQVKAKINEYIREIDKCLSLLNRE
jgi:hypothetical protein